MAVTQKSIVPLAVSGKVVHHARTDVAVRDLTVTVDEPEARNGTNKGATPTEMLMVSLAGCTTVVSHRIADRLGIELSDMQVDVSAEFDRRGVMQEEHLRVPFPTMHLDISVTTDASDDKMAALAADLKKYCPLSNVIRESGTDLTETWTINRP